MTQVMLRAYSNFMGIRISGLCQNCGAQLEWHKGFWRLALLGGYIIFLSGIGFLGSMVKLIVTGYVMELYVMLSVGIFLLFIGMLKVELVEVKHTETPSELIVKSGI